MKIPLTLVVVTLNEERNIARCLNSAAFASEIIIVDSFSTDRTCEIAKEMGAKVFQVQWQGYGATKNYAVSLAQNDWVLCLDADEALSDSLKTEILNRFRNLRPDCGYLFPRRSFYLGRWINYGGWYPDKQLRLFNKKYSNWSKDQIHEKVTSPKTEIFNSDLHHWVFKNIEHQVLTNNRYSSLQAEDLYARRQFSSLGKLIIKPVIKFMECYFLKRGFLDGMPGFIIAVSAAYSVFLKFSKLWQLHRIKNIQDGEP